MAHQGSDGQQAFGQGDTQHRVYATTSMKQNNNAIVSPSINVTQNNVMQNNTVAMSVVQQQHQIPMLWKGQAPIVPSPSTNIPAQNNQKQKRLSGSYAPIVPSNGMISMNTQIERTPPIAPLSAPNVILAPEPISALENNSNNGRTAQAVSKSKPSKSGNAKNKRQCTDHDNIDGKTEKNRERNREHARSTRLRKKAYIQKLKDMAQGLRAVQTKEIRDRRQSMQNIMNVQKVRRAVVQTALDYHSKNEKDPSKWNVVLESSFWMKEPITPFRSFRSSEIDRDCRIVRGVDAMICDAASIAVMVERIGCNNARWRRIKRSDFLDTLDNKDTLIEGIGMPQQPESSLSSESSTDSSDGFVIKPPSKRKRPIQTIDGSNVIPMVSSSSENYNSTSSDTKTNTSSSDEAEKETLVKYDAGGFRQHKTRKKDSRHSPVLSSAYLNRVSRERISSYYAVNQDDMIVLEDVLMCPFVFRTSNAVLCGSLADCVVPGMLRAHFSKNNKLLSMELIFDAMGLMQQLGSANGDDSNAHAIPSSLESALLPCPNEARVITEAVPPYSVIHANEAFTRMTNYSQTDLEGNSLLSVLQREKIDSVALNTNKNSVKKPRNLSNILADVQKGQPGCTTCVNYNKDGKPFVNFICSYPLANASDQISHMLHVSIELPQTVTLIS